MRVNSTDKDLDALVLPLPKSMSDFFPFQLHPITNCLKQYTKIYFKKQKIQTRTCFT